MCTTSAAPLSGYGSQALTIIANSDAILGTNTACCFNYNPSVTPVLSYVSPLAAVPGDAIHFAVPGYASGTTTDIQTLSVGQYVCSFGEAGANITNLQAGIANVGYYSVRGREELGGGPLYAGFREFDRLHPSFPHPCRASRM